MRIAFVHDWLVTYRGGEKVLETLLELYPNAPVFTLFYDPDKMPESIRKHEVIYPRLLAPFKRFRKALLPLLPFFIERLDFSDFDLVISSSSCVAKGIKTPPNTKHLCYLHSPMRYIWDQQDQYVGHLKRLPVLSRLISFLTTYLRHWDQRSAKRVDRFLVNSSFVGKRVERYYGQPYRIVHPPIDQQFFEPTKAAQEHNLAISHSEQSSPYFLAAGAFVPYKRFDLAVLACKRLGKRLIVAGSGSLEGKLRQLAGSKTTFEISPNEQRWQALLAGAEALIFPGVEDFGLIPIEAMASGTPVIALNQGGALDYIEPGRTGEFFCKQEVKALTETIENFDKSRFDKQYLKSFAARFNREGFKKIVQSEITQIMRQTP